MKRLLHTLYLLLILVIPVLSESFDELYKSYKDEEWRQSEILEKIATTIKSPAVTQEFLLDVLQNFDTRGNTYEYRVHEIQKLAFEKLIKTGASQQTLKEALTYETLSFEIKKKYIKSFAIIIPDDFNLPSYIDEEYAAKVIISIERYPGYPSEFDEIIEKINSQRVLRDIAASKTNERYAFAVLNRITSEQDLFFVSMNSNHDNIISNSIGRISNRDYLKQISERDLGTYQTLKALEKLKDDQATYASYKKYMSKNTNIKGIRPRNHKYRLVQHAVSFVKLLSNKDMLEQIMQSDTHHKIKVEAAKKLYGNDLKTILAAQNNKDLYKPLLKFYRRNKSQKKVIKNHYGIGIIFNKNIEKAIVIIIGLGIIGFIAYFIKTNKKDVQKQDTKRHAEEELKKLLGIKEATNPRELAIKAGAAAECLKAIEKITDPDDYLSKKLLTNVGCALSNATNKEVKMAQKAQDLASDGSLLNEMRELACIMIDELWREYQEPGVVYSFQPNQIAKDAILNP